MFKSIKMKAFILINLFLICNPVNAVTTKMFRVLDACARYRLGEINSLEAIEKLKLKNNKSDSQEAKNIVKMYCAVFTPNEKIDF